MIPRLLRQGRSGAPGSMRVAEPGNQRRRLGRNHEGCPRSEDRAIRAQDSERGLRRSRAAGKMVAHRSGVGARHQLEPAVDAGVAASSCIARKDRKGSIFCALIACSSGHHSIITGASTTRKDT